MHYQIQAFESFQNGKINQKDFILLVQGSRYKLVDFAIAKFELERYLNKYLNVSAPGEAVPSLKKSFIKLKVSLILLRHIAMSRKKRSCTLLEFNSEWTNLINSKK